MFSSVELILINQIIHNQVKKIVPTKIFASKSFNSYILNPKVCFTGFRMSASLQWSIIRNNSSFLVKSLGNTFTKVCLNV